MDFRDTDSYVADADKFEFISNFESWTSEDLHKKLRQEAVGRCFTRVPRLLVLYWILHVS